MEINRSVFVRLVQNRSTATADELKVKLFFQEAFVGVWLKCGTNLFAHQTSV